MNIKKQDWLGINHSKINEKFEGDLTFVNYMNITSNTDYIVAAVYKAANPNREKGHKDYLLLFEVNDPVLLRRQMYVSGRDQDEIEKDRKVSGVLCTECDTVLISLNRHNFHGCGCPNETFVDGGRDYTRYGGKSVNKIKNVTVDMLTDEVIVDKPKRK